MALRLRVRGPTLDCLDCQDGKLSPTTTSALKAGEDGGGDSVAAKDRRIHSLTNGTLDEGKGALVGLPPVCMKRVSGGRGESSSEKRTMRVTCQNVTTGCTIFELFCHKVNRTTLHAELIIYQSFPAPPHPQRQKHAAHMIHSNNKSLTDARNEIRLLCLEYSTY